MKYSNTALKTLAAKYKTIFKKCALINAALLIGAGLFVSSAAEATINVAAGTDGEVYLKSEVDSLLNNKADSSAVATLTSRVTATETRNGLEDTALSGLASIIGGGATYNTSTGVYTPGTINLGTNGNLASTVIGSLQSIDGKLGSVTAATAGDNASGTTFAAVINSLDNVIGNRTYTEQNVITNGQSVANSLNALDMAVGNLGFGMGSTGADVNFANANYIEGANITTALTNLDTVTKAQNNIIGAAMNADGTANAAAIQVTTTGGTTTTTLTDAVNQIGNLSQLSNGAGASGNGYTGNVVTDDPNATVADHINALDARLGQIDGLAGAIVARGGTYYGNLSNNSTVEDHLVSLDSAIGDLQNTGVKNNGSVATQLGQINNDVQRLENEVRGGFAAAAALSALVPNARATNDTQIAVGSGMYRDRVGFGLGAFHYVNDNVLLNAGVAYGGSKSTTVKAGVTFGW